MRLICPNCDAQYEVEAAAIPEGGRDVQCSNCGYAWFHAPLDLEAETALFDAPKALKMSGAREAQSIPDPDYQDPDQEEDEPAPVMDRDAASAMIPPIAPRRGIDESLLAVLREEAEREAAARRSEPARPQARPLESQTDLGLEETGGTAKAVRDRLSRLHSPEPAPDVPEKPAIRRDLLPDIEEINSTLRASTESRDSDVGKLPPPPARPKKQADSGFRSGFSLMMFVVLVLLVAYIGAPKIVEQFPATKAAMDSYVVAVNAGRVWLDQAVESAISSLQSLTGSAGG